MKKKKAKSEWGRETVGITQQAHNFEDNAKLSGLLISSETFTGQYGEGKKYVIETGGGKTAYFFGSKVLNDKMASVQIGEWVGVKFLGTVKGKSGNNYKDYEVVKDVDQLKMVEEPKEEKETEKVNPEKIPF